MMWRTRLTGCGGRRSPGGWIAKGVLQVSFHSRDPKGMGTVNVAARPWNQPLRKSGFVMSGHQGPSLTLLQRAFAGFRLDARLRMRGTVRLLVDYDGVLGPNLPQSDATLHPLALSRCDAVELNDGQWKVIRFGASGEQTVLASGTRPGGKTVAVGLDRKPGGETSLFVDERALWSGELPPRRASGLSVLGIAVEPHSHLVVEQFTIQGKPQPAVINFLFSEAILGAGGSRKDWQELRGTGIPLRPGRALEGPGGARQMERGGPRSSRCGVRAARSSARRKSRWTGACWRTSTCTPSGSRLRSRFGRARA